MSAFYAGWLSVDSRLFSPNPLNYRLFFCSNGQKLDIICAITYNKPTEMR